MRTTKQKSIMENVANYSAAAATAVFLLAITSGLATAEDVKKQQVFFTATVNGGAAMIPVSWVVTGKGLIKNETRHQFRLSLANGSYEAKLVCNSKTKATTFTVKADSGITVIPAPPAVLKVTLACD